MVLLDIDNPPPWGLGRFVLLPEALSGPSTQLPNGAAGT